ncbi:MAG: chromate transporter [Clostridia bacterium]|nr:chromate transporter [Clostridia bacterium]MBP3588441.1 chromate transporter [Clostridia bacterium]
MEKPTLRALFLQMFTISACTFGGGFVIVTLMKKRLVEQRGWLSESEMLDMTALAQSAPGPIAVNTAVLVGWHLLGFPGMLTAVLGCILPPMIILSVISLFYAAFAQNPYVALLLRGMQAGVAAVILDVTCSLGQGVLTKGRALSTVLLVCALALVLFTNISPILLLLCAALTGILSALLPSKKGGAL